MNEENKQMAQAAVRSNYFFSEKVGPVKYEFGFATLPAMEQFMQEHFRWILDDAAHSENPASVPVPVPHTNVPLKDTLYGKFGALLAKLRKDAKSYLDTAEREENDYSRGVMVGSSHEMTLIADRIDQILSGKG